MRDLLTEAGLAQMRGEELDRIGAALGVLRGNHARIREGDAEGDDTYRMRLIARLRQGVAEGAGRAASETAYRLLQDDPPPEGQTTLETAQGEALDTLAAVFGVTRLRWQRRWEGPPYAAKIRPAYIETDDDLRARAFAKINEAMPETARVVGVAYSGPWPPFGSRPWRARIGAIVKALATPRRIIGIDRGRWGIALEWNPRDLWRGAYVEEPSRGKNGKPGAWNIWYVRVPCFPVHIWWGANA